MSGLEVAGQVPAAHVHPQGVALALAGQLAGLVPLLAAVGLGQPAQEVRRPQQPGKLGEGARHGERALLRGHLDDNCYQQAPSRRDRSMRRW